MTRESRGCSTIVVAAGSLAGLIDGFGFVGTNFEGSLLVALLYAWAATLLVVSTVAAAQWAWCRLGHLVLCLRGLPYALWTGLPLVAFACWVPHGWIDAHWQELSRAARAIAIGSYFVFGAMALAAAVGVHFVGRWLREDKLRVELRYGLLLLLSVVAASSYLADRFVLVGLYEDFHMGLAVTFVLALTGAMAIADAIWAPFARLPSPLRRYARWALPGAALLTVACMELTGPDVFGPSQSVLFDKLTTLAREKTDFDEDGASAHFGGTDCAGFDPRRAPGRFDFPGNGRDEDCTGQDAEWPLPPPALEYTVPEAKGFNVVLITVDALRADHLGSYGYRRNTSPVLDALAARSVRFARAFSPSSKTFGSLPSILSGLYPSNVPRATTKEHKTTDPKLQRRLFDITSDAPMLSELFAAKGYATAVFSSPSAVLLLGLGRGFDEARTTQAQVDASIEALSRHTGPFFHWLHLHAPHAPYEPHPEHYFGEADIDRYDGEIAYDDARIGRLLSALDERGLTDKTIIIVSADHGEEFHDHGGQFHTYRLYRELIHVPLIVHIPGVAPRVVDEPVEAQGITPTLCELLQLLPSCDRFDGRSLLGPLAGAGDGWGAFSELVQKDGRRSLQSLYTRNWHLIRDYRLDRVELYDVVADPNEKKNLANKEPEVVRELNERMLLRPLSRAGAVFREYERTKDLGVVAAGLHAIQNPSILPHAFKLLEQDPARFRAEFDKLRKRPALRADLKEKATRYAKGLPVKGSATKKGKAASKKQPPSKKSNKAKAKSKSNDKPKGGAANTPSGKGHSRQAKLAEELNSTTE